MESPSDRASRVALPREERSPPFEGEAEADTLRRSVWCFPGFDHMPSMSDSDSATDSWESTVAGFFHPPQGGPVSPVVGRQAIALDMDLQDGSSSSSSTRSNGSVPTRTLAPWIAPWERTRLPEGQDALPTRATIPTGSSSSPSALSRTGVSDAVVHGQLSRSNQAISVGSQVVRSSSSPFSEADTAFTRRASRFAGFSDSSLSMSSREDLLEQGIREQEANAIIVRVHENEVLMMHFRRWILCFSCIMLISMPTMLGIFVWMVIVWWSNLGNACKFVDVWVGCTVVIVVYNATLNRPSSYGSFVARFCCRWYPDPDNPRPTPLRVRVYSGAVIASIFVWNCIGLRWTTMKDAQPEPRSCRNMPPEVTMSVQVYAAFNLAFTIFAYTNMVGLAHLLRMAVRMGLLHTSSAAPKGALEKSTKKVAANDPAIQEQPSCSVCLEEFGASSVEIRKTIDCGHLFCRQCLQGWLNINRTCPLCRRDLGRLASSSEAREGEDVVDFRSADEP